MFISRHPRHLRFICSVKVLLIHQHFKTPQAGGAVRSYYLAKALVDRGIKVEVITAHDAPYKNENVDGINVHYLKVPYNNNFGFAKRSSSFLKFVWKAVLKAKVCRDADLCYAISVPLTVGLAAIWIKKKYGIPFLFEVGDLWPDAPIQMGFITNYFFKQILWSLERRIYNSAESVVALSPEIKTAIEKKTHGKQVHLLPNMADTDFFQKTEKNRSLEEKFNVKGKFVISYIGAIGVANGLDYFIECANASRKAGLPIHFMMCGDGALKERLKRNIKSLELENISVLDFTNRDGVNEIMSVTDASFVCYKPVQILETGSPNKFFDALAAGKLIIINFGGWIKKEIEASQCGFYVNPFQPTDFIKAIKPFLSDRILFQNYQYQSRTLAEKKYSRSDLSEKFYALITTRQN